MSPFATKGQRIKHGVWSSLGFLFLIKRGFLLQSLIMAQAVRHIPITA